MRIDYDLIEKINDEIYDNDDYYNEEYYQVLCKKLKIYNNIFLNII